MRLTQLSMALALAITASSAAQAQQFTKVVSFGDSLSDAGNVGTLQGLPAGSSFLTNPDPIYSQILSSMFGLGNQTNRSPLIPTSSAGTNFAYGGACAIQNGTAIAAPIPGLPTFTCSNSPGAFSLQTQFTTHLTANGGVADPNALYTYWAGANDILSATAVTPPGGFLPNGSILYQYLFVNGGSAANASAIAQTIAGQAGATAVGQIKALQTAGAKNIVVFNLPDLGLTPLNIGTANQAGASALSAIYNLQFNGGLATLQDGIIAINTYAIINEIKANPAAFGFTNTTGKACPGSSLACGPLGSYPTQPVSGYGTYLFADDIHPSGRAHALLANVVYSTITAPGIVSLAPEVALQAAFGHSTAVSDALDSEWAAGSEVGKVRGFTSVQFGQQNIDATAYTPALDGDSTGLNVGATYRFNEGATMGVAASLTDSSANAGAGAIDGNSILFSIFGQYEINGLYGRLGLGGGSTDTDISRKIDLGASVRTETGSTGISQTIGTLEVGYVFKGDSITHGPFAGVELNNTEVEGYTELGASATAMRFDSFTRDSNMTRVGYQFAATFGGFKPFARASWVSETNTDQTNVRGGTSSLPANFVMPGFAPSDDSYIDWDVGASMTFADSFDGFISYRARSGNDSQDNDSINVGIRKTF